MTTGPTPKTFAGTSALGSYADSYRHSWAFNFTGDSLNLWNDILAYLKIPDLKTFAPGPDDFNSWADFFGRSKSFNIMGDSMTMEDAFSHGMGDSYVDDVNQWLDALGIDLQEVVAATPLTVSLSDTANEWWVIVASG